MTDMSSWFGPILVSPFIGSFMGVLIQRLPAGEPVVAARSACPHCGARLSAWELVPVVSYVALRGLCGHCRAPIGWFHPAVELAAVAVACLAVLVEPDPIWRWAGCGLGWTLLTLSWIDFSHFVLPDELTLPLALAGLAFTLNQQPEALTDHCLATAVGYLSFQGLALGYRRLRGREGLGGGDAKLIAAAGAWCGLGLLPFIILGSAAAGLLTALGLALRGRAVTSGTRISFGPCIAASFWVTWLYAGSLNQLFGGP